MSSDTYRAKMARATARVKRNCGIAIARVDGWICCARLEAKIRYKRAKKMYKAFWHQLWN